jgi:hypothetical protein
MQKNQTHTTHHLVNQLSLHTLQLLGGNNSPVNAHFIRRNRRRTNQRRPQGRIKIIELDHCYWPRRVVTCVAVAVRAIGKRLGDQHGVGQGIALGEMRFIL